MKHLLLICCLLMIFVTAVRSEEASVLFDQANQLYRANEYQKAARGYEQVIANGYESPALYYNLGNAFFKMQNNAAAILNYERARRLAPHDEDILYNLRLANLRIVDRVEPVPELFIVTWWKSLINLYPSGSWSWIGIASFWLLFICAGVVVAMRSILLQRIALIGGVVAVVISLIAGIAVYQRFRAEQATQAAILMAPSASVKSAPDAQSTDLFMIHEGVKVEFLDAVGDWRKIRLADGKVGWLQIGTMELI